MPEPVAGLPEQETVTRADLSLTDEERDRAGGPTANDFRVVEAERDYAQAAADALERELERVRARARAAEEALENLSASLDEMRLHDDTGDPRDEGYMAALEDVDRVLASIRGEQG